MQSKKVGLYILFFMLSWVTYAQQGGSKRLKSNLGPLPTPRLTQPAPPDWDRHLSLAREEKMKFIAKFIDEYEAAYLSSRGLPKYYSPFIFFRRLRLADLRATNDIKQLKPENPPLRLLEALDYTAISFENSGIMQRVAGDAARNEQWRNEIDRLQAEIKDLNQVAIPKPSTISESSANSRLNKLSEQVAQLKEYTTSLQNYVKFLFIGLLLVLGGLVGLFLKKNNS